MIVGRGIDRIARVALLVGWTVAIPAARGQDAQTLAELKRLHEKLVPPTAIISLADGRAALDQVNSWNLAPDKLEAEQRGWLFQVLLHGDLAVGDAARAADCLSKLQREFARLRATLHAQWQVAIAAGDAELATRTLSTLKEQGAASEKSLSTRRDRLEMVGQLAPAVTVKTADGKRIALQQRDGVVLLLDFWSLDKKPDEKQVKALRELYLEFAASEHVRFLGVNTGPSADLESARRFVADKGYEWPQYFQAEPRSEQLDELFHVKFVPWQVILDREGNVRAVGVATEPEFVYALRAAVAEAAGEYVAVRPKTTAGVEAEARTVVKPAPPETKEKEKEKPVASGDLPHNAEATSMLNQARVYLKTGRKTDAKKLLQEIVEKYPGTWEAKDAQETLDARF
jgi:peroxiredoxin